MKTTLKATVDGRKMKEIEQRLRETTEHCGMHVGKQLQVTSPKQN